ncbi:MAG: hypothetical protein AAF446_11650 [Pseudomonadota bacterium]
MIVRFGVHVVLVALVLLIAACSSETPPAAPEGLEITLTAANDGAAPCRIERVARYDQSSQPMYMIRGEGRYSLADGSRRSIPVQIRFLGMDGIVDDEAVTLTDFDATCDQVSIEWTIEECESQDRDRVECPPFDMIGETDFRSFELVFEQ